MKSRGMKKSVLGDPRDLDLLYLLIYTVIELSTIDVHIPYLIFTDCGYVINQNKSLILTGVKVVSVHAMSCIFINILVLLVFLNNLNQIDLTGLQQKSKISNHM